MAVIAFLGAVLTNAYKRFNSFLIYSRVYFSPILKGVFKELNKLYSACFFSIVFHNHGFFDFFE